MSLPLRVLEIPAADLVRRLMADLGEAWDALRRMGFRDPAGAIEILNKLAKPGERPPLPADLFRELIESPDPDMALSNFERLVMAAVSPASFFHTLEADPRACHVLIHILGGSQFLSDILVRDPQYFYWLTETSDRLVDVPGRVDLLAEFEAGIARFGSTRARLNALRRFNRKELLRLGAGDLVGERPIEDVAQGLSDLADACLQTLLNVLTTEMEANYGSPKNQDGNPAEIIIVALGKLGGRELNFSSDIDLMFVYSEEGETDGGEGRASNQEFYTILCERLIHAVSEPTEEGFLYKVDLRQRPDGTSGALTMPMSGYESYYARRGELWERQMLIKARICAGSAEAGSRFLHRLRPFIYPGYFEVSPVKEIHRTKLSIEDRIGEKGTGDTHLKLRSGGIRDVEFIVQCLQMLVGRVHTEARSANTLEAIGQLHRASALSEAEATGLREAYLFFRRVEHRMQMMHGQSDYILPQSEEDQRSLARSLGFRNASMYRANLSQHLDTVRYIYRGVFSDEETGERRSLGALCEVEVGDPEALAILKEFGFSELETAHRNLIFLTYGHVPRIRGTRARESFIGLGPSIIKSIQESPDPDRTLASLERLVAAYGAGDMMFRMLSIHEGARDLLLSLCAGSQFLVSLMVRNPGLLDWVVSPDVLYEDRSIQEMKVELETVVDRVVSAERITTSMNVFKNRELLRIGTRDVAGHAGTFDTFDALTKLAETVLDVVVRAVYTNLSSKNGVPRNEDGGEVRFAVLGLGKLGRRELNFGSHLDLVLIYESDGQTDGVAPANNSEYFEEFVQALLTTLTGSTPYGALYPTDIRLKTQGTESTISYLAYDQYLTHQGTTEERLDFSNARFVAGDEAFGQVLLDRLGNFVLGEGLSKQEAEELVALRNRISDEGAKRSEEGLSIKTAPGGLVDFKFITGVLQIRGGILSQSNTLQAIEALQAVRRLDADDGRALQKAFSFMRTIEKVLRRQDESARTRLPVTDRALTAVARAMGFGSSVSFIGALENEMAETRKRFDNYLGTTSG